MKKQFFLLLMGIILAFPSKAQQLPLNPNENSQDAHRAFILQLLKQNSNPSAEKPTGVKQRVIAQCYRAWAGPDSTFFKYSGDRGSAFDYNSDFYRYGADADSSFDFFNEELTSIQATSYSTNNQVDSIYRWTEMYSSEDMISIIKNFFTSGNLVHSLILNNYQAANYIGDPDTINKRYIEYNNNEVVKDSIWSNDFFEYSTVNKYYYNASNKIDSIITGGNVPPNPVVPYKKTVMTYYPDNRLKSVTVLEDNNVQSIDSFQYFGNSNWYALWDEFKFYYPSTPFGTGRRIERFFNANAIPDSGMVYAKDSLNLPWQAAQKIKYYCNSFNNPDSITFHNPIAGDQSSSMHYYYEEYDDAPTSITSGVSGQDFSISPNPFLDNISIEWKGKQSSQVNVQLVNILGQKVHAATMKLNAGKNTINLPGINSGSYILIIRDANGKSWSTKLIKQ